MSAHLTFRTIRIATLCALLLTSLAGIACVRQPVVEEKPVQGYPMTPEAAQAYYFLVLNEAARNNDTRAGTLAIQQLLALSPTEQIYIDAAKFYGARKEVTLAREIVKQGLDKYPDQFDLTLLLAETYLEEKRIDESVSILRDYLKAHPNMAEARQELGQLLLSNNMLQEAVDVLKANTPSRTTPLTRYYLGRAYGQLKKFKDAETELKKAVLSEPEFVEAWAELAYVQELMKDYVAAENTYAHIIEMGQSGQEVWLRLITLNLKLNHPDKALDIAKEGPEDTGFILQAATMFLDEGFNEHARELLEPLAEENNPPAEVFFHLALIAFNVDKDLPHAIELLARIPDHNPLWSKGVRFRSHMLFELDKADEAVELLKKGIKADPGDREFWDMEIDLLASSKRFDEAHATVDAALMRWPNDPELLFSKGSIYDLAGDKDRAVQTMEQVISIDPENPQALNYVGYSLAENGENLERALVLIESALKQEPDKAYIYDSLAWVHFKLGNLEQAWEAITKTVALGAQDPVIWEHYGDIAHASGRKADARKGYKEALKLKPLNAPALKMKLQGL